MVLAAQAMKPRHMPEAQEELRVACMIGMALVEPAEPRRRTLQAAVAERQAIPVAVATADILPATAAVQQAA